MVFFSLPGLGIQAQNVVHFLDPPHLQSLHVGSTSCELNFALLACSLSVPVSSFAFTIAFCEAKGECLLPAQTWWGTLLWFSCNCRYFRVDFSLTSLFVLLFQNSAIPCLHFIFQYSTCLMLRMFGGYPCEMMCV